MNSDLLQSAVIKHENKLLDLKDIANSLHLITLPSTLWGVHVEPTFQFITVLHIKIKKFTEIFADKALHIVCNKDKSVNIVLMVHRKIIKVIQVQEFSVKNLCELSNLLILLHNLKVCKNSVNPGEHPDCSSHTQSNEDYCDTCHSKNIVLENFETNSNANNRCDNFEIIEIKCNEMATPEIIYGDGFNQDSSNEEDTYEINESPICVQFYCDKCEATFQTSNELENHAEINCDKKEYTCTICNKVSKSILSYNRHMRTHESNKLCNVCGKTFSKKYNIENHMQKHMNEKSVECEVCKKQFNNEKKLKIHSTVHTGERPFVCQECGKSYTSASHLSTHKKVVHCGKKPHVCNICNKAFITPHVLKIHMRYHTGEKPYKCTICERAFAINVQLKIHMRTHTGERPYICSLCGKGCTTTGNLTSHMKSKHKNQNG